MESKVAKLYKTCQAALYIAIVKLKPMAEFTECLSIIIYQLASKYITSSALLFMKCSTHFRIK